MSNVQDHRKLLGRRVLTQDGSEIGEIEAFHIDTETWVIRAVEVRLERKFLDDLRIKKPLIGSQSVRLGLELASGISDAMVLRLTLEGLAEHLTPRGAEGDEPAAEPPSEETQPMPVRPKGPQQASPPQASPPQGAPTPPMQAPASREGQPMLPAYGAPPPNAGPPPAAPPGSAPSGAPDGAMVDVDPNDS